MSRASRLDPRLLLAVASIAAPALGQSTDGDPTVVNPERDLEPIRFYGFEAALELEWRHNLDRFEPDDGPSRRDKEDRLREILDLRTSGYIGHPNLFELDLGGRFWLEQRWTDIDGDDDRINQTLYEWDVSGILLKEGDLPVTIYSRQSVSDVDRQFGRSLENTFRETGARFNFRDERMPTNIQIFRRSIDQEDTGLNEDFDIDQDTIEGDGQVQLGAGHLLTWDMSYDDIDESGDLRFAQTFDRFEGNATHTWQLGEQRGNVLRTRTRYYDESGDRFLRQSLIESRLRLRHSDDLNSWFDYAFSRDDRPDQEQRNHTATANFQHQLFESLTTIGTAGYDRFEVPNEDFNSDEVFGSVNSTYVKETPGGQITAAFLGTASRVDQSDLGTPVSRSGEIFVFSAADLIIIDQRNIIESSIVVRDVSGIIVYTLGVDYLTLVLPGRAEIRRVPGGSIAPGQAVRIDYTVGAEPGGTIDTWSIGVDVRYTFDEGILRGLSAYGSYLYQDESRSVFEDGFPENDFRDMRYGLEYNYAKVYLRAEQQHRRGSLSPFDALRFEGRYVEPLGRNSNLVLSGIFQEIDRRDVNSRTSNTSVSGQWNQRLGERLRLSLILQYQWVDDDIGFDSEGFEQIFNMNWQRGRTEFYTEFRNSFRDARDDETTLQRIIVGMRREF